MKIFKTTLFGIFFLVFYLKASVLITTGYSASVRFDEMVSSGRFLEDTEGSYGVFVNFVSPFSDLADHLKSDEIIRISLFENYDSVSPFRVEEISGPSSGVGIVGLLSPSQRPWQDRNGLIGLSMISGSAEIDSVSITTTIDSEIFDSTVAAIPEVGWVGIFMGLAVFAHKLFQPKQNQSVESNAMDAARP